MKQRASAAESLGDPKTRASLKQVVKPGSLSRTLRRTGVALILTPDPVTAVPGAVLLGASLVAKRKSAASASSVFEEAERLLREMGSLV